ncbi:MAG: hypothetical protein IPK60_03150 [Sandaracinaceae bacterium]|nr:hypothetical protein [Sandaracinaceae bacterium]
MRGAVAVALVLSACASETPSYIELSAADLGRVDASVELIDASPDFRSDAFILADTGSNVPGRMAIDSGGGEGNDGSAGESDAALRVPMGPWRSSLYPSDWTPNAEPDAELFLHDFSYAGYHNGQARLGEFGPRNIVNVVDSGADATGSLDSTDDVQHAIDSVAETGGVIYFPPGLYRFDGELRIRHSHTVLRGAGPELSKLYFSSFRDMRERGHIDFEGSLATNLDVPLAVDKTSRANFVEVADAGDLRVGDEVSVGWVISPEFVADHGMTGVWRTFNGSWQRFFRRTITAVDRTCSPHRISLDVPLRYPAQVRDGASLRRESGYLKEVGLESLGISDAVAAADAWSTVLASAIRFTTVEDAWMRDVHSFASPLSPTTGAYAGYHLQSRGVTVTNSKRVTVADSVLEYAENRGGGGNGYLFEMTMSNEILFRDDVGRKGRHNFIQNYGFGTTGCVWLRVHSYEGLCDLNLAFGEVGLAATCTSEFHHSLAIANLVDSSVFDDGMKIVNRGTESTGSGHTGTENVLWNTQGTGDLISMQFGNGYVIGTQDQSLQLNGTLSTYPMAYAATAPDDFSEGLGNAAFLEPQSLYDDQLARRLAAL